jgi:hypothetical protein
MKDIIAGLNKEFDNRGPPGHYEYTHGERVGRF